MMKLEKKTIELRYKRTKKLLNKWYKIMKDKNPIFELKSRLQALGELK